MTTPTHPNLFCPQCRGYLGAQPACDCGYQPPRPLPSPGQAHWQASLPGQILVQPLPADDLLLVGVAGKGRGKGGALLAVLPADGAIRWQLETGKIKGRPARYQDTVIFGSGDGFVHAVNLADGAVLWVRDLGHKIEGAVTIDRGVAYLGSNNGELTALNAASGALLWTFSLPQPRPIKGGVLPHEALLILGAYDGGLYALDRQRGRQVWRVDSGGRIAATPRLAGHTIISADLAGNVLAVDALRGREVWRVRLDGAVRGAPALDADRLYLGTRQGSVYALDAASGAVIWRVALTGQAIAVEPLVSHDLLYLGDNAGWLYALNLDNGSLFWRYPARASVFGSPVMVDDTLYAGTETGTLLALPWHLGQWAVLAARYQAAGNAEAAAIYHALAADETFDYDQRESHLQAALRIWWASAGPERAPRLLEAMLALPGEIAEAYKRAGKLLARRNKPLAAACFAHAAHHFEEAGEAKLAHGCRVSQGKLVKLPRLGLELINYPPFEAGRPGQLTFDVRNFGQGSAHNISIRLAGELARPLKFSLESLPPQGRVEVQAKDITPLGETLRVDFFFTDRHGQVPLHSYSEKILEVTSIEADVLVEGDAGAMIMRLAKDAPLPKVRVRGDAGLVKIEMEP